ncbi:MULTISPECIES: dihydrodipicolinate synthase family protein [Plantibacter]|uniref:dihydrodipicolinate synthase family protein n=1 Tax=Plantibacter TaxID=190323 RepID=UPI00177B44F5|nr:MULTISPECIES: dihydrodipicolinate synthase family protein [Plantibacter]MBD8102024.1 dihydrodipicolinate synthase family protein [Plantibacter sp. CFBP 8775]MBD8516943.1 dihydrodipicolinate synthase family protein [Plantibacter sp. CFBP 8804]MBD8537221.1 dihydrodipicolinate synthase family protein [Plantibacter sp. CFBP 13570]CAH0253181.1 putative DapA-like lyase [Plantibacter cousiniae]
MAKQFDLGGVIVATTLAFKEDASAPAGLAVDYDRFAEHCNWLIENGCRGVGPNGSLGEYSSLTDAERRKVIQVAVDTVGDRGLVVAGVHGVGWHQAQQWAEYAKEDGADGVLLLPPTIYRANDDEVIEHYSRVDEVGLPIMAYNNPIDTKVDLTPDLLVELAKLEHVVAVKEFSADIRRVLEIQDKTDLDVIAGADDLLFESLVAGAVGWFAGYPNAFPREAVELYTLVTSGRVDEARTLYRELVPVFGWDSKTEFVQAIKLSIDIAGESYGGPTRPPRGPLNALQTEQVTMQTRRALDYLAAR